MVPRNLYCRPIAQNDVAQVLVDLRPIHDIDLEGQVGLAKPLGQRGHDVRRQALVAQDSQIEIGILFRCPGRARPEGDNPSVRHVPPEDISDYRPMIGPKIKSRLRRAHARRSRNFSRR